jgi:aspartyl-tRNA(Asn)/glutamyl-tRNA(Gln) amidotransferase subunit A
MPTQDLHFLTIAEAAQHIAAGDLSPVELTAHHLRRIETLHSFLLVTAERALARARVAEAEIRAGRHRGPLHGIPFGLKDVYDTADIATTGNSKAFRDRVPTRDATTVRLLEAAGAVLLGKQATHELTFGGVSSALPWPPPCNPWNPERDTGGSSSGGGAAVAAGLCMMALGTDTGGSIRNPSAHCGIVGLKPTYGRVSRVGVMMNSYTFDHCGPLTRTVRDCALVLGCLAGYDPADPAAADVPPGDYLSGLARGIDGLRIGWVRHLYERDLPANEPVRDAVAAAVRVLEGLGARAGEATLAALDDYATCKTAIQLPEIYAEYRDLLAARPDDFGAKVKARIMPAAALRAVDLVAAQARRRQLIRDMTAAMAPFDVLVTAGPYGPAPRLADVAADMVFNKPEITGPFNVTGFPALTLPMGFAPDGLPLSLQIVGKPFDEATVLRVAHAYEQATDWHRRHPIA